MEWEVAEVAVVWSPATVRARSVVLSGGAWPRLVGPAGAAGQGRTPTPPGPLGRVVRVYRRFRPVPRRARGWIGAGAAAVAVALCLAVGQWWPAPVVAAVALVVAGGYGRLRAAPGLRAVRVHEGGLVLVGPAGGERPVRWEEIEASEHVPGGPRGAGEQGRIWLVGAEEPVRLAQLRGLEGLFREVDGHLSPRLRAGLHEALRAEGSVRFARGRLTVTRGALVHRPAHPAGTTEAFRWAELRSVRAAGPGELEIRTRSAGLPLSLAVTNARAAAEFLEEVRVLAG
ncbi:hypothetical protein ACPC54_08425 [Kitasatospora sp. NPDC094028]